MSWITEDAKKQFIKDLVAVCAKHGMCLAHEDSHGSFIVTTYNIDDVTHMAEAYVEKQSKAGEG